MPLKTGAVSAAVLSATLFATGSAGGSSTGHVPFAAAAPVYAHDVSLFTSLSPSAALSASPSPTGSPAPSASASAPPSQPPPPPPAPQPPRPVAGLDQTQMNNAAAIVRQGRAQGMPDRGLVVAIATAMQESDLYNVASPAVPASLRLPHEGVSQDHDSVGLFQQRAGQGWGSVAELMNPSRSASLFYNALVQVNGWERMSVTAAAQAVQRSAYPGAYQKHANRAATVVAALS
ncbi:hypothetical protein [Dactylosporangium sp. CA-092794]|uniref:hypothetical protein n=1 Tax=Dactylosporangium sp. CA-092794 TaxID=3239929 RepID=UPI003D91A8A8